MDKGYDSEHIHKIHQRDYQSRICDPVRKWNGNIYSGKYRMKMRNNFNQEKYRQRNMVETVFSLII